MKYERAIEEKTKTTYKIITEVVEILPEARGLCGRFILSISISKTSLIIFPADAVKAEDRPASIAILKENLFVEQIRTATTAVKNIIIKFIGRRIFRKAVILIFNLFD